jgi:hypothetical protein
MRENPTNIDLDGEVLVDIDCTTDNFYLVITDKGNIVTPFERIKIAQTFDFPVIRLVENDKFLIADSRVYEPISNCFLYDFKGNVLSKFFAGDGIQDIEVVKEKIIVTYFDEGIYGMTGPNNGGLVVFDIKGNIELNYNERHGKQMISDCYCICRHGTNRVLFFPYDSFQLTELNLENYKEKIYLTPKEFEGCNSLTSTADSVFFHSPYNDKRALFKWTFETNKIEKIGEYLEGIRGLKNGRFLSKGEKGFTIIDLC